MSQPRKPLALTILIGGGFTLETKYLLAALNDQYDFVFLVTEFGGTPGVDAIPFGESYSVPYFSTVTQKSVRKSVTAFLHTLKTSFAVIRKHSIDTVIVVGCSHAVPMLLAGRLLGCDSIYLESITRVDQLSLTGKMVYYLKMARIFIVQWPKLQQSYPSSRLGTIL